MAQSLISETLREAFINQISHEQYNSNLYLYIAGFFRNKGLDKLADKFLGQYEEEISHTKKIFDFLTDMNALIEINGVDKVELNINFIKDVSEAYLQREIITTDNLEQIKAITIKDNHGVAEEFIREMINLQRNELAEASVFSDLAELCGSWLDVKLVFEGVGN